MVKVVDIKKSQVKAGQKTINPRNMDKRSIDSARKLLMAGSSPFIAMFSGRDEAEVSGAVGALRNKSLKELQDKYSNIVEK